MRFRVDCGLGLVMASFSPTKRLRSVDFPALGRPTTVTMPARVMAVMADKVVGKTNAGRMRIHTAREGGAGDGLLSRVLSDGVPSAL